MDSDSTPAASSGAPVSAANQDAVPQGQRQPARHAGPQRRVRGVLRQLHDQLVAVAAERQVLLGVCVPAGPRRRGRPGSRPAPQRFRYRRINPTAHGHLPRSESFEQTCPGDGPPAAAGADSAVSGADGPGRVSSGVGAHFVQERRGRLLGPGMTAASECPPQPKPSEPPGRRPARNSLAQTPNACRSEPWIGTRKPQVDALRRGGLGHRRLGRRTPRPSGRRPRQAVPGQHPGPAEAELFGQRGGRGDGGTRRAPAAARGLVTLGGAHRLGSVSIAWTAGSSSRPAASRVRAQVVGRGGQQVARAHVARLEPLAPGQPLRRQHAPAPGSSTVSSTVTSFERGRAGHRDRPAPAPVAGVLAVEEVGDHAIALRD